MTIYVGNLPYKVSETEIEELFAEHGTVHSVKLISDRETGKPRGFGFVEMDDEAGEEAIEALNGTQFGGRTLHVNPAREKKASGNGRGRREGQSYSTRGGY